MGIIPQNSLRTPVVQHRPGGTAPPNLPQRRCDTGDVHQPVMTAQTRLADPGATLLRYSPLILFHLCLTRLHDMRTQTSSLHRGLGLAHRFHLLLRV